LPELAERRLDKAVEAAKLDRVPGKRRPTLHDLRDTFASALIDEGVDVVQVSKQLGHADPTITLRVYADLFNRARNAERTQRAIDSAFGNALETTGGNRRRSSVRTPESNVDSLLASSRGGD
jgi:integrase